MLSIYKSYARRLVRIDSIEPDTWVSLIAPTESEMESVCATLGVEPAFLRAALDEEETSRIDFETGQTLVVIDVPVSETGEKNTVIYSTLPLGIIVTERNVITVTLKNNTTLQDMSENVVKNLSTEYKTQFVLHILLRAARRFLYYLRQIDKISSLVEKQLHQSMKNKELFQLLELEKSMVYLSTSLRSNEITMKKIAAGKVVKLYEEDRDLMDDVLIELNQAIEMASIFSGILSGMMDAFASVISNNLNIVMKALTSITVLLTIPTIIFSFYGMNVDGLPLPQAWFPVGLSVIIMAVLMFVLRKKDLL